MSVAAIILAVAGAAAGVISTAARRRRERDRLDAAKENHKKQFDWAEELANTEYGIHKDEAFTQLGKQERGLRDNVSQFTEDWNTSMLARAFGEQDARIGTASETGASLAFEGMGGTRGNAASGLMRGYASRGLERQIDVQRRRDSNALTGTLREAGRAKDAIGHERSSWEEGGWRHGLHEARAGYNENIFNMQQDEIQRDIDWHRKGGFADYTTAFFSGASSGQSLGRDWDRFKEDWISTDWNNMFISRADRNSGVRRIR